MPSDLVLRNGSNSRSATWGASPGPLSSIVTVTIAPGPAPEPIRKRPGRTEYQRGIVGRRADGHSEVRITGSQGSGILRSMSEANGLVVLAHEQGNVAAGEDVDVLPFDGLV